MEDNPETPAQKKMLAPIIGIGVVVLLALLIGGFLLSKNQAASKEQAVFQGSAKENAQQIQVEAKNFSYNPSEIRVKKDQPVVINLTNSGGTHDFVIDEFNVKSKLVNSGETIQISFTPTKTGTFEYYCSVGNHRAMGMHGNLIVE